MIKKSKIRIIAILPVLLFSSCSNKNDAYLNADNDFDGLINKVDNHVDDNETTFSFSGNLGSKNVNTGKVKFNLDYRLLVDGNNQSYSRNLAYWSIMLAGDIYDSQSSKIENAVYPTRKIDDYSSIYRQMGCEQIKKYILSSDDYLEDKNDLTTFITADHSFEYNKNRYTVVFVTVEGTNGNAQWSSNFDVGNDTESYTTSTGSHTQWIDRNNHKGFDVAADRVYSQISKNYLKNSAKPIFFVSGHSRGAAIANIVAKRLTDGEFKTFGYTFATPATTCDSNYASYKNIFNFVNDDDLVTKLPLAKWGFNRFGVTFSTSVLTQKLEAFQELVPDVTYSCLDPDSYMPGFNSVCNSRDDLYDYSSEPFTVDGDYSTPEAAIASFDRDMMMLSKYKVFFKVTPTQKTNGKYCLTIQLSPQLVFTLLNDYITGSINNPLLLLPLMKYAQPYTSAFMGLLNAEGSFEIPHLPATYLAII